MVESWGNNILVATKKFVSRHCFISEEKGVVAIRNLMIKTIYKKFRSRH